MRSVTHIRRETVQLVPMDGYKLINTIGVGTFGAVFLCENDKGEKVAIKKSCLDPHFKNRELEIVCKLKNPNTLEYITHKITKEGPKQEKFLLLITGYLPMNLTQFMQKYPFPPPIYLKVFGYQMFSGLAYLHAHGVAHRDIKPSNVLVDPSDGRTQLCDFGSAKFLVSGEKSVSYIATRSYRAPELILDCQKYTFAVDIWAAGCVLAELLLQGKPLFNGANNMEILQNITKIVGTPKPEDLTTFEHTKKYPLFGVKTTTLKATLPKFATPEFIDLLTQIFVYDPTKRPTAAQCMKHPFFAELFTPDVKLPNGRPLPEYFSKIKSAEDMLHNYPDGPHQ